MNGLADSVLDLSEEEILSEERDAGADPLQEAARLLGLLLQHPMQMRGLPSSIRIVIADDHPIFRDGLRRLLEAEGNLKVLGEASDGAEAVKLVRKLKPDILLLDLAMPKHPGVEALRDLSSPGNASGIRVILLTATAEKGQIVEALRLGSRGVVLKDSATQLLLEGYPDCCGWRILGRARERIQSRAISAHADAIPHMIKLDRKRLASLRGN